MEKSTIITLGVVIIVVVLGFIAYKLLWSAIQPKLEHRVAEIGLTENEKAANGPLPGDVSLYQKEFECCQNISTPGYFQTLCGAELADAQRSAVFPCATFLGSFDGPNKVFAWRSEDDYESCTFIVNRYPGEIFIVGGDNPPFEGTAPPGPYIAKADATTGRQVWRTYVDNVNASKRWIGAANLNILASGRIAFAWANQIVLLDADTGRILKQQTLPTGACPVEDANFKHLTVAPDGTLLLKDQTRPTGNKLEGTLAIIKGVEAGLKQPNSYVVAVNPDTLEILAELPLPEPATVPHSVAMFDGKIAIYIGVDSGCLRAFWDPAAKKLTLDDTWHMKPMQAGQTTSDAPAVIGDWIAIQTNGLGSKEKASSIAVANVHDSSNMKVIFPFGELKKGEWSWAPPKSGTDVENNMIYSADMGVGKVAGIKLDPATGELKTAFVLDNMSTTFQPLYGPKDKRVLVLTNMRKNVAREPNDAMVFTGNYTEQVTWNDAATGRQLAASDFFEPLTINSLVVPAFGGRCYFPTKKGFITLQVMPAAVAGR
jgi:hypothetical protein